MNIAVQIILKGLKENGYDPVIATSSDPLGPSADLKEYASADESDLVSEVHRGLLLCVTSLASAASLDSLAAFAQITLIPSFPRSQTQSGRVSFSFYLASYILPFCLSLATSPHIPPSLSYRSSPCTSTSIKSRFTFLGITHLMATSIRESRFTFLVSRVSRLGSHRATCRLPFPLSTGYIWPV